MFQRSRKSFSSLASRSSGQIASKSLSELNEPKDFDGVMKKIMLSRAIIIQQQDFKDHKPIVNTKSKNDIDQMISQVDHSDILENIIDLKATHIPLFEQIQKSNEFDPHPVVVNQVVVKQHSQDIDEVTQHGESDFTKRQSTASTQSSVVRRSRALTIPSTPRSNENFVSGLGVQSRDIDEYFLQNKQMGHALQKLD
eukprot:NODE_835_length_3822_cov_0.626377.p3 type:complete len:197 gc:universal NODE_835_length_3822_cov_0.626377:719-129(-)